MRSTLEKIKDRADENLKALIDYITGNRQKTLAADEIDLEDSALLDDAIKNPDQELIQSKTAKTSQVGELSEAYALKRDLYYTYAGRSWIMNNGIDSKLGDDFRNGRWANYCEKLEKEEE